MGAFSDELDDTGGGGIIGEGTGEVGTGVRTGEEGTGEEGGTIEPSMTPRRLFCVWGFSKILVIALDNLIGTGL